MNVCARVKRRWRVGGGKEGGGKQICVIALTYSTRSMSKYFLPSGGYSSEPRWVSQGVTEPAHGTHTPSCELKSTGLRPTVYCAQTNPRQLVASGQDTHQDRDEEDIDEIFESHMEGDKIVNRLLIK